MRIRDGAPPTILAAFLAMIVISGVVTDEGAECRAMRGDDGELYTFRNLPDEIAVGDRIEVRGERMLDSPCQQGVTLEPVTIRRQATEERPEQRWD